MAHNVLNDYVIDASITSLSSDECLYVFGRIDAVFHTNTVFFDCGYLSKEHIRILSNQSHYLMRVRDKLSKMFDELPLKSHVITMYGDIRVCIIEFKLPSKEVEMLIFNLFDLPDGKFNTLYFPRWGNQDNA